MSVDQICSRLGAHFTYPNKTELDNTFLKTAGMHTYAPPQKLGACECRFYLFKLRLGQVVRCM